MDTLARSERLVQHQSGWMARRILLAIALMVGFYVFAVIIAFALMWVPYAEYKIVGTVHIQIAAVCIGAAITILWALVPRPDRFEAPGPRLDEARHPRLFEMVRQTAAATEQTPPEDVYLLNEVNAWVTHRGGAMGFGSRRVMGVGLPLLQATSIPEFRAILAHEFGHYWSGDVTLGPWIHKTRATIARTLAGVNATFVQAPFIWYAKQFLKLTHAVSRQQEFIADQVAVRVAGAPAVASALRRITPLGPIYSSYMSEEVMPVLRAGFLPPVAKGFDAFLKADRVATASEQLLQAAEDTGQTDMFDTHPSLRDRIAALGAEHASGRLPPVTEPASALLADPEMQACALIEFAAGPDRAHSLKAIAWEHVGQSVVANAWREVARSYSQWLGRFTADGIPIGRREFIHIGSALVRHDEENVNADERIARAVSVLGVALGVLLLDDGWEASTSPGMPVVLARGSQTFDPFGAIRALAQERTSADSWKAECHALGIAGRPLGGVPAMPGVGEAPGTAGRVRTPAAPRPSLVRVTGIRGGADVINCWRCKRTLPVSAENRGKTVKCPECGTRQQMPL